MTNIRETSPRSINLSASMEEMPSSLHFCFQSIKMFMYKSCVHINCKIIYVSLLIIPISFLTLSSSSSKNLYLTFLCTGNHHRIPKRHSHPLPLFHSPHIFFHICNSVPPSLTSLDL